jgi:hypothetical protein
MYWTGTPVWLTLSPMISSDQGVRSIEGITEDELEALIARYTLEYIYRWTNDFDAAALSEFKKMLDKAGTPEAIVGMLRSAPGRLPN